jgi:ATP-dependent RNA helicase DeaD
MDTTTEFEISKGAAESFAAMIRRPDKEDNIRIEAMTEAPQSQAPQEKRSYPPRREAGAPEGGDRPNDRPREERGPKAYGKPSGGSGPGFAREPGFDKKKKYAHKPAYAGKPAHAGAADAKPAFGKKKKKNRAG